jgi:hypothetical protein
MRLREFSPRSLEPTQAPLCPKCGTSMWVVRTEDDARGWNRHTYECPECYNHRTIVIMRRLRQR